MAETPEPSAMGDQHNHGPGIFIAGDVIGDVHHHASPRPTYHRTARIDEIDEHESVGGAGRARRAPVTAEPSREKGRTGPLKSLIGNAFGAFMLFGMAGYGLATVFMPTHPTSERVISVPLAIGLTLGGLVPLASSLAVLAELCAAGAANAAGSAGGQGREGRWAAARLNLRQARLVARTAHHSAELAGLVAALVGFLAVSRRAADRAQKASDRAESEVAKACAALQRSDPAAR
ncbi:hypothetical protein [Streptomyces lincolnensis]|uniref:hypothetical protein n=1 Tax=Streptomyces lincolnensis TaxID=1915 RepID=UPI0037CD9F22